MKLYLVTLWGNTVAVCTTEGNAEALKATVLWDEELEESEEDEVTITPILSDIILE